MAHGVAEVERALAPVPALTGQAHRQPPGERVDGAAEGGQLVLAGVHELDLLGQGLAQRLGHGLGAAVGDEAAADLRLHLLAQAVDAGLVLVAHQPLLEGGEAVGPLPRSRHEPLQNAVEVEVAEGPVQVVRAAHRPSRLHPREAGHRLSGQRPQHGLVGMLQRTVEHLRQFLGRERLHGASLGRGQLVRQPLQQLVDVLLALELVGAGERRASQREVHLEDCLESLPVGVALDQGGGQRVLERLAVLEWDVADRLHGVEVLGERHRQPCRPELPDEPGHQVDHRRGIPRRASSCGWLTQARPPSTPWRPWRCRSGT